MVGLLYTMQRKNVSFSKRVFTGLGLGIAYGLILHFSYGTDSTVLQESMPWFNIIGVGYVKLLQMIVMPLVFISILAAFTKVTIGKDFGKMAGRVLGMLIGTTAIAAIIGISATLLFGLDASEIVQGEAEVSRGVSIEERAAGKSLIVRYLISLLIYCQPIHSLISQEHVRHQQLALSFSRLFLDLLI